MECLQFIGRFSFQQQDRAGGGSQEFFLHIVDMAVAADLLHRPEHDCEGFFLTPFHLPEHPDSLRIERVRQ